VFNVRKVSGRHRRLGRKRTRKTSAACPKTKDGALALGKEWLPVGIPGEEGVHGKKKQMLKSPTRKKNFKQEWTAM